MFLVWLLVIFCVHGYWGGKLAGVKKTSKRIEKEKGETFSLGGDNEFYLFLVTIENRVQDYGKDASHHDSVREEHSKCGWEAIEEIAIIESDSYCNRHRCNV